MSHFYKQLQEPKLRDTFRDVRWTRELEAYSLRKSFRGICADYLRFPEQPKLSEATEGGCLESRTPLVGPLDPQVGILKSAAVHDMTANATCIHRSFSRERLCITVVRSLEQP